MPKNLFKIYLYKQKDFIENHKQKIYKIMVCTLNEELRKKDGVISCTKINNFDNVLKQSKSIDGSIEDEIAQNFIHYIFNDNKVIN